MVESNGIEDRATTETVDFVDIAFSVGTMRGGAERRTDNK
jgi:hypothetical protein